jgi:glycosyltransferase involved in cell wall biosynthesis
MNVLLIHQAFASHGDAGGTRHFELARYCSERGCRFTIVTSASSYLTGRRKKQNEIATSGLIIHRALALPDLSNNFFWRLLSFSSFACSSLAAGLLERKMDVVLGTSPPIFQAVAAWLTAVCRRRPFVLEVRDLWPEFAIDMGILRNKLLIYLSRRLEIFLYRRARHIIVNSPAYREHIMQKGIAREKISLIANGVDTAMFAVKTDERRCLRMWGLEEKYVVIYAGAMGRANDLGTLLQSASLLKEQHAIHFLLLGDGKERNRLQTMARELSLNNVTFAGAVAREEMPRILAECDACVAVLKNIPMFRTTYPNKVFDYMAAGRPTVLAIDGVIRQVVEAAQGGVFVPPGNAQALAGAIEYLVQNPDKAAAMGRSARLYVQRHFERHKQAEQFYQLLLAISQDRAGKRPLVAL